MPFSLVDAAGVVRALQQIADRDDDRVDAYFERIEEITTASGQASADVRRESGLAVRLARGDATWLASSDGIDEHRFADALRRASRGAQQLGSVRTDVRERPWTLPPEAPEILELRGRLEARLEAQFPARSNDRPAPGPNALHVRVTRHRRESKVVGPQLTSATDREVFYSLAVTSPWGRSGGLLVDLRDSMDAVVDRVAREVGADRLAARAEPPAPGRGACILGPAAAAVLLHEAVAHALEADVLAESGHPDAAVGVQLGSRLLDVFDDPAGAPAAVRRRTDDEGFPVLRRCLLRAGVVTQPLADTAWADRSERLEPGAGRRGDRHEVPGPRSHHLELVPNPQIGAPLWSDDAEGGLYLDRVERGHLDPRTGRFDLRFAHGQRIRDGRAAEPVGGCRLHGRVADVLGAVVATGDTVRVGGAGWCAKGGVRLPVWATSTELRLAEVEIA